MKRTSLPFERFAGQVPTPFAVYRTPFPGAGIATDAVDLGIAHESGGQQFLSPDQVEELVAAGVAAAIKDINRPDPNDRPPAPGSISASNVNLRRARRPSISRAMRALVNQSWKGAELERDIVQATTAIYGVKSQDDDDDDSDDLSAKGRFGITIPATNDAYLDVLEKAEIRTPASTAPGFKEWVSGVLDRAYGTQQAAVKALAEGTPSLTASGGGVITPIQYLTDRFELALTSAIVLRQMPEVLVVPVNRSTIELPRESAAAAAAATAENATITPNDPTLAIQEFQIKKQARLQLFSNELLADSTPAIDAVVSEMLGRDVGLLQDSEYLEGSGAGAHVTGLRNYSGLTTSGFTAATNGSSLTADNVIDLLFDIYKANANPTAFVMHPRTLQSILKLKDASGRYLFSGFSQWGGPLVNALQGANFTYPNKAVGTLNGVPVYLSTQILINETQGSSSAATHVIYGDFRKVLILERQAVDIFLSEHYAMNADQTAIRITARSTVAVTQPKALAVATGII